MEIFKEVIKILDGGYEIVEFSNGKELLDHLRTNIDNQPPCLIILDMNMAVMDGRQTLMRLKEEKQYKAIPVVVFTTSSNELDRSFCHRYGTEMISKPPSYVYLQEVLKAFLILCNSV